jgi:hypothetical protein
MTKIPQHPVYPKVLKCGRDLLFDTVNLLHFNVKYITRSNLGFIDTTSDLANVLGLLAEYSLFFRKHREGESKPIFY